MTKDCVTIYLRLILTDALEIVILLVIHLVEYVFQVKWKT